MKLLVALLLLASIVVVFSRSYSGDCSTKLMDMDDAVDKALLLTNPNLKPYTDAQDFRDTYCK